MADKNTGISGERLGRPSDEQMTGRESTSTPGRSSEYATSGSGAQASPDRQAERERAPDDRTREIRAEIEQTREDMSETVNAIQDRLRPGNIASSAADSLREAASERARDIAESDSAYYVRANPIPTAMVGIGIAGLAWMAFGGRDPDDYRRTRYRARSRDRWVDPRYQTDEPSRGAPGSREYGTSPAPSEWAAGSASSGATEYGSRAGAGSGRRGLGVMAYDRAWQGGPRAHRAQDQLRRTWDESPLLIGAAAAVLGALVGSAVPKTEREDQLMGEARDSMVEGVEQAVKEKVEQVQNAATDAVSTVQKAVGLTAGDEQPSSTPSGTAGGRTTNRRPRAT